RLRLRLERGEAARVAGVRDGIDAGEVDPAAVGPQQPDDLRHERRLAGAVVAEEADHLPGADPEVHVVVGEDGPEASGHALDGQDLLHGAPPVVGLMPVGDQRYPKTSGIPIPAVAQWYD